MRSAAIMMITGLGVLLGCSDGAAPTPSGSAPAQQPPRAAPAQPEPVASAERASDPCANSQPQTLELEAGQTTETPWGLEFTYAIDEDAKLGPGYMFLLKRGARRWETRRDNRNWTSEMTWQGFCWRGGPRPGKRDSKLTIQVAPVCKDGKLVELGGCGDALAQAASGS